MKKALIISCLLLGLMQLTAQTNYITVYRDADTDGYGNPNDSMLIGIGVQPLRQVATTTQPTNPQIPNGYVKNNLDCNDNNASLNPNTTWYLDNDKDGFGINNAATNKTQCADPSTTTIKYVLNNTDCNDTNIAIKPNTIWYLDSDKDGFGTNNATTNKTQCADPSTPTIKYVLNNSDTNDANPYSEIKMANFVYDKAGNQQAKTYCLGCNPNTVATNATASEINAKFYPSNITAFALNTAQDLLTIQWTIVNNNAVTIIKLYDMKGKELNSFSIATNTLKHTIAFGSYSPAIYYVKLVYQNNSTEYLKITKK